MKRLLLFALVTVVAQVQAEDASKKAMYSSILNAIMEKYSSDSLVQAVARNDAHATKEALRKVNKFPQVLEVRFSSPKEEEYTGSFEGSILAVALVAYASLEPNVADEKAHMHIMNELLNKGAHAEDVMGMAFFDKNGRDFPFVCTLGAFAAMNNCVPTFELLVRRGADICLKKSATDKRYEYAVSYDDIVFYGKDLNKKIKNVINSALKKC